MITIELLSSPDCPNVPATRDRLRRRAGMVELVEPRGRPAARIRLHLESTPGPE